MSVTTTEDVQLIEALREDPRVGLTHTLGGNAATVLVSLFGRE